MFEFQVGYPRLLRPGTCGKKIYWVYPFNTQVKTAPKLNHMGLVAGGMNVVATAVEYRVEAREMKARIELDTTRTLIEKMHYSPSLLSYAIESRLKLNGMHALFSLN